MSGIVALFVVVVVWLNLTGAPRTGIDWGEDGPAKRLRAALRGREP